METTGGETAKRVVLITGAGQGIGAAIARRFAAATSQELGWSPDDFVAIVTEMAALARRAIDGGAAARKLEELSQAPVALDAAAGIY